MSKEQKPSGSDQGQEIDVKIEKSEIHFPDQDNETKDKKKKEPADAQIKYRSYKVSRRMGTK